MLLFSFLVPGAQDDGKKWMYHSRSFGLFMCLAEAFYSVNLFLGREMLQPPVLSLGLSLSVHGRDWPEGQLGNWAHLGHG